MREYAGDSWSPGPDTKAVAVPNVAGSPLEALPLPIALQMSQSPPAKRWNASGHVSRERTPRAAASSTAFSATCMRGRASPLIRPARPWRASRSADSAIPSEAAA